MVNQLGFSDDDLCARRLSNLQNKIEHLVAFNELQHQLYNQMLHSQTNEEWYKVEELLENLRKYAAAAGVAGDFGWAVQRSIRSLIRE